MAQKKGALLKLSDTNLTLGDPEEDVRGRKAIDRDGEDIGTVEDLFVDDEENKVRFLQIGSGGFLGIGERKFLIPVDAITRIDADHVHVDQTREHVAGAPEYDPEVTPEPDYNYYEGVYGYYGYPTYWGAGYAYPPYPRYP
jgi:sporulation protein YlmC with PRC-barrel domain